MIDKNVTDRNRFINGILIVAAIVLLVASIYSVYSAWRVGLAQSRAETASRLMAVRTSPRSTETPGVNAWVSWSLLNNYHGGSVAENRRLKQLVIPRTDEQFPDEFRSLLNVLAGEVPEKSQSIEMLSDSQIGGSPSNVKLEFRKVNFVRNSDQLLVLTARSEERIQSGIESFAANTSSHLIDIKNRWLQQGDFEGFGPQSRLRSARVARFYVLSEDESLISLPLADTESTNNELYLSEGEEFRKNPRSPTLVSNNFFFNFDFDQPLDSQATFTGMYLDLGGLGLVASVIKPIVYEGKRCALGADVAFDIDWEEFARDLSPNLISHVAHVPPSDSTSWNPWNEFNRSVPRSAADLKNAMRELADRAELDGKPPARKSIYLALTSEGDDVVAIQVDRTTWLLLLVAGTEIALPWATMLLTSLVFFALLFRIEQSRRKAVQAQRSATGQLQEKQNLLDTMQVPLMVVDPNTDQVIYCNRAAGSIGMIQGAYFGKDVVSAEVEAQEQYRRTQTLGEEHRRAYGVPIRVKISGGEEQTRHAIVRSVAVTAPIAALKADERHRLGILFLIDEQVDLALLMEHRLFESRQDEKRRLSGLLNHGADSLARVLAQQVSGLTASVDDQGGDFASWLSEYLAERIQMISWTLENWSGQPVITDQRIIERDTVRRTLEKYEQVFQVAAADRSLRERLHWNNGPAVESTNRRIIEANLDWDEESCFAVPRDGVFGFFLGETLTNAIRHGKADSAIRVDVTEQRNRNEICFEVSNLVDVRKANEVEQIKPLGGLAILDELARLCGWPSPERRESNGRYVVTWMIPAIRRKNRGETD